MTRHPNKGNHINLTKAERLLMNILVINPDVGSATKALRLSPKTTENRLRIIREKLFVKTNEEAIAAWRNRRVQAA